MAIKAIIFDLDDTLFNEIEYVKSGFNVVAENISNLINKSKEEIFNELLRLFSINTKNVFDIYIKQNNLENILNLNRIINLYREHYPKIKLDYEIKNVLLNLKQKYKLGIITDGRPEGQWNKIRALGLDNIIENIIVTDELGGIEYRKPNTKAFEIMIEKFNVKYNEAIYIGDNINKDFIAPNILGMSSILLNNPNKIHKSVLTNKKEALPKFGINSLKELYNILN